MGRPQSNRASSAVLVGAFVVGVSVLALLHRSGSEPEWKTVEGTIRETRIVPYSDLETKWGSQLTWVAEYRIAYVVGKREYTVWVDSGIRGGSKSDVQLRLPQFQPACTVRYNPQQPESGVARCP